MPSYDVRLVSSDNVKYPRQRRDLDPADPAQLRAILFDLGVAQAGRNEYAPEKWIRDFTLEVYWPGAEMGPGPDRGPLLFGASA